MISNTTARFVKMTDFPMSHRRRNMKNLPWFRHRWCVFLRMLCTTIFYIEKLTLVFEDRQWSPTLQEKTNHKSHLRNQPTSKFQWCKLPFTPAIYPFLCHKICFYVIHLYGGGKKLKSLVTFFYGRARRKKLLENMCQLFISFFFLFLHRISS